MDKYKKVYNWLLKVIDSVNTREQYQSCAILLSNFLRQFLNDIEYVQRDYHRLAFYLLTKTILN